MDLFLTSDRNQSKVQIIQSISFLNILDIKNL